ncbi:hypothetical protein FWG86_01720 [Candidatus Saccharibacteria bacterium]|nr:hypothetical protein [Candidatus Saccharibacteria bacterium]
MNLGAKTKVCEACGYKDDVKLEEKKDLKRSLIIGAVLLLVLGLAIAWAVDNFLGGQPAPAREPEPDITLVPGDGGGTSGGGAVDTSPRFREADFYGRSYEYNTTTFGGRYVFKSGGRVEGLSWVENGGIGASRGNFSVEGDTIYIIYKEWMDVVADWHALANPTETRLTIISIEELRDDKGRAFWME